MCNKICPCFNLSTTSQASMLSNFSLTCYGNDLLKANHFAKEFSFRLVNVMKTPFAKSTKSRARKIQNQYFCLYIVR